jgi:hypothetical protein
VDRSAAAGRWQINRPAIAGRKYQAAKPRPFANALRPRLHRYLPEAAASLQAGAKHCGQDNAFHPELPDVLSRVTIGSLKL